MKEEVERIKKLVGIDHNRWEQPCTCDKCKNMCKVPCIGTPKDIEAIIDAEHFRRFYQTAEQCREANKPKIVMLDEEGDDFAKQKRDEFCEYVKHHCPGFEDKIEWEYFQAYKTMPWNLSQQVKFWSNYGIAFK